MSLNDSLNKIIYGNPKPQDIAGQLLMFGFDGTSFSSDIRFLIQKLRIGGVILFKRNIETPGQVHDLCMAMQEAALSAGMPPLFIAVDQEGGTVARLKNPHFEEYPGASSVGSVAEAEEITSDMAKVLKKLGFNMNMAPVLDISFDGETSIMKNRAYSDSPSGVAEFGRAVIRMFQNNGIMAVGKHFPGIGRTVLDSHLTLPVLEAERKILETTDFIPFKMAIEENVSGIMMSHILYKDLDPDWPASLSARIAHDLLRKDMGYDGLSLTDDLDMKAINHDIKTCVSMILMANVDVSLVCSRNSNQENALDEMLRLAKDNFDALENIMKSVGRIFKAKGKYLA